MPSTIRNPIEWSADQLKGGLDYVESVGDHITGHGGAVSVAMPQIRSIGIEDLKDCLRKGVEDFMAFRTDVAAIVVVYPIIGILLTMLVFNEALLPLLFPAASGFALLGPVAAVGAYELSRRRESGQPAKWSDALGVLSAPSVGAMLVLGIGLCVIFVIWMLTAWGIYAATLGPEPPASVGAFISDVLTTGAGWMMVILGFATGFVFAAAVLSITVVSFPLLLDRNVGLPVAVVTSVRVTMENLQTVSIWGLIVAGGLALGSLPAFLGLIFVLPVLGHATWHLYRKAVVPAGPAGRPVEAG